jgi:Hint domain
MGDRENLAALRARRNFIKIGLVTAASATGLLVSLKAKRASAEPEWRGAESRGSEWREPDRNSRRSEWRWSDREQPKRDVRCFLKSTRIRTADGYRKIEDLKVGDLLPTVFGGVRPIEWIGRYPYKKSDPAKAWVKDVLPVRIARSALGPDVPHADLYVTQAHEVLIDGVLVPAATLINGTTIALDEARDRDELEYFHIKLERHDVIDAEGAPCETLYGIDEGAVNVADYLRRYGPAPLDEARCAPSLGVISRGGRPELKSRLRSALSPWIDRRHQLDVLRDRFEEHGIPLLRRPELTS